MVTLRPNFWNVFRPPKLEHHIRVVKETGAKKRPQNWDRIFAVLVAIFVVPSSHFLAVASTLAQQFGSLRRSLVLNHDGQKGVLSKSVDKDSIWGAVGGNE